MHIVPFLWLVVPGEWLGQLCFLGCGAGGALGAAPLPGTPRVPAQAAGLEVPLLHVGRDGGDCLGVLAMPSVPAAPPHPLLPAHVWVGCCFSTRSHCQCGWEGAMMLSVGWVTTF